MKNIAALLLLLLAGNCFAQKISRSRALADMQFLNEAVVRGHPVNYNPARQVNLDSLTDELQKNKADSLENSVFTAIVGQALQTIGDVHTYVVKNPLATRVKSYFPALLLLQKEDLFLRPTGKDSGTGTQKIQSISGVPAQKLIAAFSNLRPADGGTLGFGQQYFNLYPQFLVSQYFGSPESYEVKTEGEKEDSDRLFTLKAVGIRVPANTPIATPQPLFYKGSSSFRIEKGTGILKLVAFAESDVSFLKKVFFYLQQQGTKSLILDLRSNTGGNRYAAVYLTQQLVAQPFSYAILQPHLAPKKYLTAKGKRFYALSKIRYNLRDVFKGQKTPLGRQFTYRYKPAKTPFAGKLVVLTNGFTSSSATMVTSWLKQHREVTFVGSQAGGGYNGNSGGSFPTLRLPNSGIEINFPVYRLILDPESQQYSGIIPDTIIFPEPQKMQKDVVLETALKQG